MSTLVTQMTKDELIEVIETVIERKLVEIFGALDEETELKQAVRNRLLHQKQMVDEGERGQPFNAVLQQLDLG